MAATTEATTIRLRKGDKHQLQLLAHKRSIEQQREVSWSAMVREVIEQVLLARKAGAE
jgi:hypothetical protein